MPKAKKEGWGSTGFGDTLSGLRKVNRLSQQELADKVGCNVITISRIERGVQEPAWPLVLRICAALNVNCLAFEGTKKP
jgi:transcriptional regulator with XRE-family HTH domain